MSLGRKVGGYRCIFNFVILFIIIYKLNTTIY